MKRILFLCLLVCSVLSAMAQQTAPEGESIIRAMYEQYNEGWYNHLTFDQETIFYRDGEVARRQGWFEALTVPGQLAIKFDSLNSSTGIVFKQDTQYVFQENQLVQQSPRVHELLVLGFDVYKQAPAQIIKKLKNIGFELSKTYETEWQGRPVYVVGAVDESDKSKQFWIDKEQLYFVRMLQKNSKDGLTEETQFNNYQKAGGGWVAPEVLFYRDDVLVLKEVYSNIEIRDNLDDSIFDLKNFRQAQW